MKPKMNMILFKILALLLAAGTAKADNTTRVRTFAPPANFPTEAFVTPQSDVACRRAAISGALEANGEQPDPEITPPTSSGRIFKVVTQNREYEVLLDNTIKYEVFTRLNSDGSCVFTDVNGLPQ